ncbi:hypothetical protein P7C70_g2453, partial [Phenoliferia sp. Uapishka_3]
MATAPTAQSVLTSLLITPTTYLLPSLSSLRSLLQSTSSSLSASTSDKELRVYLKQVTQDRKISEDRVKREIKRFRLGSHGGSRATGSDEEVEKTFDEGEEEEELTAEEVVSRLEEEEQNLQAEIKELESEVEKSKGQIDSYDAYYLNTGGG